MLFYRPIIHFNDYTLITTVTTSSRSSYGFPPLIKSFLSINNKNGKSNSHGIHTKRIKLIWHRYYQSKNIDSELPKYDNHFKGVALVTGASRGIGREITTNLLKDNYQVALISRSTACIETANELLSNFKSPGQFLPYQCDVSDSEQVSKTVQNIMEKFGYIDILVNAAGISIDNLMIKMKDDDLLNVFATNTFGGLYMARAVSRNMIKRKKGNIIFVGSILGEIGGVGSVVYSSSKSALLGATRSLAKEFGPYNIRTNLIMPDFIETDMTFGLPISKKKGYQNINPNGRTSNVNDVSNATFMILKDQTLNGQVIVIRNGTISILDKL